MNDTAADSFLLFALSQMENHDVYFPRIQFSDPYRKYFSVTGDNEPTVGAEDALPMIGTTLGRATQTGRVEYVDQITGFNPVHCQNSVRPETIDFSLSNGQASES